MTTRVVLYVVLGIILFPVLLAVSAPATWVAWGLARLSEGRVQLHEADGYLWGGEGIVVVKPGAHAPVSLGRFRWDLSPWPLFQGRVSVRVQGGDPPIRIEGGIDVTRAELAARDVRASFPADLVSVFYAPAALLGPGGEVQLTAGAIQMRDRQLDGQAILSWDGAATRFSPVRPLGDYRFYLEGRGGLADLRLETAAGALALSGTGLWNLENGAVRFDGTAAATARSAELEPLLRLFGRDQGGGRRRLALQSRTAPLGLPW